MRNNEKLKLIMDRDDPAEALMKSAAQLGIDYLIAADSRRPFPTPSMIERARAADAPLPDAPTPALQVLEELASVFGPATVNTHSGCYYGFVHGSSFPVGLAAKWLSTVWDQNTALYLLSPAAAIMEAQVEKWLVDLLGFHAGVAVGFVSSTSQSLLTGLVTGRDTLLAKLGWNTRTQGFRGAPEIRVVLSDQAHATVYRALRIAGIGQADIEVVPSDDQGRMIVEQMPPLDNRTLLVLQAGNLYTGAFDHYSEIIPKAQAAGAWTHVDGAFGLWAAASPEKASLVRGIQDADSWSADCHKTLNTPFSCGLILCRHRERLIQSMSQEGSYLDFSDLRDGMNYSPDMARRCQVAEIWATLKNLGREGVVALVESLCENAKAIAEGVRNTGYEVVNDVVFNQISVRLSTDTATDAALKTIQDGGVVWCSGGVWAGRRVIRISVSSWRTDGAAVGKTIEAFRSARVAID